MAANWKTVVDEMDPKTGATKRIAICATDSADSDILLFVRYRSYMTLELWVNWNTEIGHSVNPSVGWKIDNRPRRRRRAWSLSTNHQATFMPETEVMDMVLALSDAEVLSVEVHPFGRNPISASFQGSGFAEAVEPLLEALRQAEKEEKAQHEESMRMYRSENRKKIRDMY